MSFFPNALENLIDQFAALPGVGRKSAQRLAFHVLSLPQEEADRFANAVLEAKKSVHTCPVCQNLTEGEGPCAICRSDKRDGGTVCVVADPKDVIAMERTREYHGLYHVLHGLISPMDGIGPSDIEIESLVQRVAEGGVKEVIFALSSTMEGDTTNFYISRKLADYPVKLSVIARGISVGDELEYTDEVTLGRSILNRTPFGQ